LLPVHLPGSAPVLVQSLFMHLKSTGHHAFVHTHCKCKAVEAQEILMTIDSFQKLGSYKMYELSLSLKTELQQTKTKLTHCLYGNV